MTLWFVCVCMLAEAHVPVIRQKNGAWNMTGDSKSFATRSLEFLPSSLSCRKATERIKINNIKSEKSTSIHYKHTLQKRRSSKYAQDIYVWLHVKIYMCVFMCMLTWRFLFISCSKINLPAVGSVMKAAALSRNFMHCMCMCVACVCVRICAPACALTGDHLRAMRIKVIYIHTCIFICRCVLEDYVYGAAWIMYRVFIMALCGPQAFWWINTK